MHNFKKLAGVEPTLPGLPELTEAKSSAGNKYVKSKLKGLESGGSGWTKPSFHDADRIRHMGSKILDDIKTGLRNDYMDENEAALNKAWKHLEKELKSIFGSNTKISGFISNMKHFLTRSRDLSGAKEDLDGIKTQMNRLAREKPPKEAGITKAQAKAAAAVVEKTMDAELDRIQSVLDAIDKAAPDFLKRFKEMAGM